LLTWFTTTPGTWLPTPGDGITKVAGTVTAGLLEESFTVSPPAGTMPVVSTVSSIWSG
jgi:hypothetical protein